MTDRDKIIEYLKEFSMEKPYVNAMWLEGADGLGQVDEYSDLDFWFDVEKSHQESFLYECVAELEPFYKITCLEDIEEKLAEAEQLFARYEREVKGVYFKE